MHIRLVNIAQIGFTNKMSSTYNGPKVAQWDFIRNFFHLDSCVAVECYNSGETCQSGVCRCGNEPTCEGNTDAPVCDTEKGKCVPCK